MSDLPVESFEIAHVNSIYFDFIIMVVCMEIEICDVCMIYCVHDVFVSPVHLHKSEVYEIFSLLIFRCDVITWWNLQYFVYTKIVVWKIFYCHCLLKKLVQKARVQYLAYRMLRTCPVVLNMLELRNYFNHLLSVHLNILIEEFLDTIGAEIQKYRNFL